MADILKKAFIYPDVSGGNALVVTIFLTIDDVLWLPLSFDKKWTWPRIFPLGGRGLGEDGVDNVIDLRSSERNSKLCDLRPESTIEMASSGDEAFFDTSSRPLRPLSEALSSEN